MGFWGIFASAPAEAVRFGFLYSPPLNPLPTDPHPPKPPSWGGGGGSPCVNPQTSPKVRRRSFACLNGFGLFVGGERQNPPTPPPLPPSPPPPQKIVKRLVVGFSPSGAGVNLSPYSFFITHFHTSFSSSSSHPFHPIISPSLVLSGLVLGFHHKFPKFKSFYPSLSSHLAPSFIIFIIISGIFIIPGFLGSLTF